MRSGSPVLQLPSGRAGPNGSTVARRVVEPDRVHAELPGLSHPERGRLPGRDAGRVRAAGPVAPSRRPCRALHDRWSRSASGGLGHLCRLSRDLLRVGDLERPRAKAGTNGLSACGFVLRRGARLALSRVQERRDGGSDRPAHAPSRLDNRSPTGEQIAGFDVQHDGTLAVLLGRNTTGRDLLAWRALGGVLKRSSVAVAVPPTSAAVRFVGGRLVFVSPRSGSRTVLVSMDLDRHVRTIAAFGGSVEQVGGIDASLQTVTWSSRLITATRTDCPPPGELRPCRLLKSGVETVWAAGLSAGAPRVVASWPFADAS